MICPFEEIGSCFVAHAIRQPAGKGVPSQKSVDAFAQIGFRPIGQRPIETRGWSCCRLVSPARASYRSVIHKPSGGKPSRKEGVDEIKVGFWVLPCFYPLYCSIVTTI